MACKAHIVAWALLATGAASLSTLSNAQATVRTSAVAAASPTKALDDQAAWAAMAVVDPVADQARTAAGGSFVADRVDLAGRTVAISLYQPPASLTANLTHKFGFAVDIEAAANSPVAIESAKASVEANVDGWLSRGVDVRHLSTTFTGHLEVGVASDTAAAQALFDDQFGSGLVIVVSDTAVVKLDTYRYNDVPGWNGGDLMYTLASTNHQHCTTGPNLQSGPQETASDASNGDEYMVFAGHCFDNGDPIHNGWLNCQPDDTTCTNAVPGPGSSEAFVGTCCFRHNNTWDVGLLKVNTSIVDFNCDPNCQGRATQEDSVSNHVNDQVCISNGFDGQRCGLVITSAAQDRCNLPYDPGVCLNDVVVASRPDQGWVTGHGDSGAPVYSYDPVNNELHERGILDGHSQLNGSPNDINCPSVSLLTGPRCGNVAYFIDLRAIMNHYSGLDLHVNQ